MLGATEHVSAGVVSGVVTDSADGSPIPFCTLRVMPSGKVLTTDVDGRYSIELPSGEHTFNATYVGFEKLSKDVTVGENYMRLDITMTPNSLTLGEVVVTAKESEGMSSASKIDRAAMSHLQPTSFTDLLELLPGNMAKTPEMGHANSITLRETGNYGASGTLVDNPDYAISSLGTLFVIDGAPVNGDANMQSVGTSTDSSSPDYSRNTTNKGVDMRTISTDNIESVEIVRGIPSAEYGNLTSGMVNIRRIRRATPLSVRFKADQWSKLVYAGKGFFVGHGNIVNIDVDYMDSKVDPRDSREGYKRITAAGRFTGNWMRSWGTFRLNAGGDFTGSFDDSKVDPDLSNGKIDEYKNSYRRASGVIESSAVLSNFKWLSNIDFNVSASYQDDVLKRRRQVAPSRPSAAPTTMEPGVQDGHYIIGEYIADYKSVGRPVNLFAKLSASGRAGTEWIESRHKAGFEWNYSKNYGEGQVYDLTRPISASWTSRPRKYSDIPGLHVLAWYVQELLTLKGRGGDLDMQIGVRGTSLAGLDRRYSIAGKVYLDPRINVLWHTPRLGRLAPYVGAGWGMTTKMPTVDYLYPQAEYHDIIQLNYYDILDPQNHSRLNLRTYIEDPTNYDLKPARNYKWEVRIGATLGDNRLTVTYFNERLRSGFRYTSVYSPFDYRLYDASVIDPYTLTGVPSLEDLPYTDCRELDGYRRVTNGTRIDKSGIEFTLNTQRWNALRTALTVSGAWFKSTYSNSQPLYSTVSDVVDGVTVSKNYVGLYDYNDGRVNEQFNTNFMFDTQINKLGLVFTTSVQCMWFVKSRMLAKNGRPTGYLSASDGLLHDYTDADAEDPVLRTLIKQYNDAQFNTIKTAPAVYLNFKASKSIGRWLQISLFVNRIIDWLPDYKVNGLTIRRKADAYFGMEINLKI